MDVYKADPAVAVSTPLLPDVGVIALVPDQWRGYWQPRHHVLTRLSRYYHVVWMNPAQDLRGILKGTDKTKERNVAPYSGFSVYDPECWLPLLHRPRLLADFTFRRRLAHANQLLTRCGARKCILYMWRPNFARAMELAKFDASCYHLDDEYSFSASELPIPSTESRLLSNVTQVFVHSPGLMEKKGGFNRNTEMVPNGVDFRAYSNIDVEPSDLATIPRPRIGYMGWLKKQLDFPLLLTLTERHPEWSFVFIGPVSPHAEVREPIEQLRRRSNVYLLGAKPTDTLASYPHHFDVCIMPYAANAYTKYIYPLKLHEYLAAGRPTVGTCIRSLQDFSGLMALPVTPDEWSTAIGQALLPAANTPAQAQARQAVARRHDWQLIVQRIARTLALRLGPEYMERLNAAECYAEPLTVQPGAPER